MKKLPWLVSVVIVLILILNLLRTFTRDKSHRTMRHSVDFVELLEPANCLENIHEVEDKKRRIDLVRDFLSGTTPEITPRENIVVFGVPGALSEVVGESIGKRSNVFYVPNLLESHSHYIDHDPTIALSFTVAVFENIFRCDFQEKFLVKHLMQNQTLLENLGSSSCVARGNKKDDTIYGDACLKVFSDWLRNRCFHDNVTVVHTDQLRSISYLDVLASKHKSRVFRFRVVHVVRDPRAIIHDLSSAQNLPPKALERTVNRMCTKMRMNLKIAQSYPIWRRDSYKLVKIEEFLKDLEDISQPRHNWSFTNELDDWKYEMPVKTRHLVETECKQVLDILGYSKVIK